MKKILSLVLAFAMVAGTISGCGKKEEKQEEAIKVEINKTGYPVSDEKITLKVMGLQPASHADWNEMTFFKQMEEMTNIHMDFTLVSEQAAGEKKSLSFAGGDLPDIFFKMGISAQEEMNYGDRQKLLLPLEDYIKEYAPNLQKILDENPEIRKVITTPENHIYTLPYINELPRDITNKLWVNKKWLDKLGLDMPQTTDEFFNMLKAFKEQDPNGNGKNDEIPVSFLGITNFNYLLGSWGILRDKQNVFVNDDNKVLYVPQEDSFREALRFFKKLYDNNLIDPETFTMTGPQQKAKGSGEEELLGIFLNAAPRIVVGEERAKDYVVMPPLKDENGDRMWTRFNTVSKGSFAMTKNNKNPEATMRWIDYLYTDEGAMLVRTGAEGKERKVYEDGSWEIVIPEGKSYSDVINSATPWGGTNAFPTKTPIDIVLKEKDTKGNEFINKEMDKLTPYLREIYPQVYFSLNDQKTVNSLAVDLNNYVDQMFVKFIMGDEDIETGWDAYKTNLKNMGVDQYIQLHQTALDEYNKK